jgi:ribose 5-phosphate isomerase B
MRIAIGADRNGREMKEALRVHLETLGHRVEDFGVGRENDLDYPDVAEPVARAVAGGQADRAVLICGTGLGMAIVANKVPGVRAASVTDPYSAERAIKSNNALVLCLGARVVGIEVAKLLVDHWLTSRFAGGDSARKVAKIDRLDALHQRSSLARSGVPERKG